MSEKVSSFFELIADSSIFEAAFTKAKRSATEFAGTFKATSASVEADANKLGIALERNVATGAISRAHANRMIAQRLAFYGDKGGLPPASEGGHHGLSLSGGLMGLYAGLGVAAAGLGVASILTQQVAQYAEHSAAVLRDSQAIGINAQQLQTWQQIAKVVGLDTQSMTMSFERFGKNLAAGAPQLKAEGITLKELGITTTDVGKAILQLADYFHAHNDQAQKALIATALFGRSGTELIPILDQGSKAFRNYQTELQKMGVLLSNSQLIAGAQAQVAITNFSLAFNAAKDRLIGAALPGFTMFFEQLSRLLINNGQLWTQIGQVISRAVSYILGVIAGLTGTKLDFSTAPNDAGAAYEGLGGAAKDAAGGIDGVGKASKALSDAIQDQIELLQQQKRAQDEVYDAQKAALQDQLDTLKDVVDGRRRQGEDIVSYQRRLHELNLQDQIKAIEKQKTSYDRGVDDHIAALQREQKAVKDAANAMGASLAAGTGAGVSSMISQIDSASVKVNQKIADLGVKVGQTIKELFSNPSSAMSRAADNFGRLLGKAMWDGMVGQVPILGGAYVVGQQAWAALPAAWQNIVNSLTPTSAEGRITTGPTIAGEAGTEVILPMNNLPRSLALMERSGLAALARSAGAPRGGSSQIPAIVINFNGPVATELVANDVWRAIEKKARQRGLALQGGFG